MIFDSCFRSAELQGEGAGFQVAAGADFQRDLAFRKQIHQAWIVELPRCRGRCVRHPEFQWLRGFSPARPLRLRASGGADRFLPHARRPGEMLRSECSVRHRRSRTRRLPLNAQRLADSTTSIAASTPNCRAASNTHRKRRPRAFERLCCAKQRFEVCFGQLLSKEHHADRESDLGVDDALREQMFGKVARDKGVVLRLAQKGSHPLESFNKFGEVAIGVTLAHFCLRS